MFENQRWRRPHLENHNLIATSQQQIDNIWHDDAKLVSKLASNCYPHIVSTQVSFYIYGKPLTNKIMTNGFQNGGLLPF